MSLVDLIVEELREHPEKADEIMAVSAIYDHAARVRSYELLAELAGLSGATPGTEVVSV